MTNPDPLGRLTLPDRRNLDLLARDRRGCNFLDLTLDQARELLYEMRAEAEIKEAYIRILEERR